MSLLDDTIKESDWRTTVIEYAELRGWRVYHVTDVRKRLRSHTSIGFPDLVLARNTYPPGRLERLTPNGSRIVFAELKTEKGETTDEQDAWLNLLKAADVEVYVWRPSDWFKVEELLE